jgi:hypothetical protein
MNSMVCFSQTYCLSRVQDTNEQRTEPYLNTVREQPQFVAQQSAKRAGLWIGFADTRAGSAGSL